MTLGPEFPKVEADAPCASFLIGRGVERGHDTILAPANLTRADVEGLARDVPASSSFQTKRLSLPDAGSVEAVYASETVTGDDVGQADSRLVDEHGRPLQIIYGVISPVGALPQSGDLQKARSEALDTYAEFLQQEPRWAGNRKSHPIAVAEQRRPKRDDAPVEPVMVPPAGCRITRPLVAGVCAGALAVLAAATIWWVLRDPSAEPPSTGLPCVSAMDHAPSFLRAATSRSVDADC